MSGHVENLGPLWEGESKNTGLRMAIPDPVELAYWMYVTSTEGADTATEDVYAKNMQQALLFTRGQSRRFLASERVWETEIEDGVIESIRVDLSAGYSPESGEWGDLALYVDLSEQLENDGRIWQFAQKASQIAELLQLRGFDAQAIVEEDGSRLITIVNAEQTLQVRVHLGYTSQEEAEQHDPDYQPGYTDSISIVLDSFPVAVDESPKALQHAQKVVSFVIDALYEVCGMEAPDIVLELSVDKESK